MNRERDGTCLLQPRASAACLVDGTRSQVLDSCKCCTRQPMICAGEEAGGTRGPLRCGDTFRRDNTFATQHGVSLQQFMLFLW